MSDDGAIECVVSLTGSVAADAAAVKCELASEVLRSFGVLRFRATGWSMIPTVWPGETLVVERVTPDQVRIGDIVLVGREGRLCAHRVVSMSDLSGRPQWITRGDAMSASDRPVGEDQLLGRVTYLIRAGKCVPVPAELSVVEQLTARIVSRSLPAARALVYLHGMVQAPEKSATEGSVLPCQG
jgi:signal peptidase I